MQEIESFNNSSSIKFCNSDEIKCTQQGWPWLRTFNWFLVRTNIVSGEPLWFSVWQTLMKFTVMLPFTFISIKRMKWKSSDIDPRLGPELDTSDHVPLVPRAAAAPPAPAPLAPADLRHGECTLGLYGEEILSTLCQDSHLDTMYAVQSFLCIHPLLALSTKYIWHWSMCTKYYKWRQTWLGTEHCSILYGLMIHQIDKLSNHFNPNPMNFWGKKST